MQLKGYAGSLRANYPDVRKLRNEVNQLKAKAESEKTGPTRRTRN